MCPLARNTAAVHTLPAPPNSGERSPAPPWDTPVRQGLAQKHSGLPRFMAALQNRGPQAPRAPCSTPACLRAIADLTSARPLQPSPTDPPLPSLNGILLELWTCPSSDICKNIFASSSRSPPPSPSSLLTASGNSGSAWGAPRDTQQGLGLTPGTYPGTLAPTALSPKGPPCPQPLLPRCWAGPARLQAAPSLALPGDGSNQQHYETWDGKLLPQPEHPACCSARLGFLH